MKIAVFGTGTVGTTIASKLVSQGHEVKMGSRTANNEKAVAWAKEAGPRASHGTFAEAGGFGEIVFNCTLGTATLEALNAAGAQALENKILIDVSNPLDFSQGMPPSLFVFGRDSLAEQIQRAFPKARVVKALNTISSYVMVDPGRVPGEHATFVSGNDAEAKQQVTEILRGFGWKQVIDLGDITTARGTEAYLMLWIRLWGTLGTADFNVQIVKAG